MEPPRHVERRKQLILVWLRSLAMFGLCLSAVAVAAEDARAHGIAVLRGGETVIWNGGGFSMTSLDGRQSKHSLGEGIQIVEILPSSCSGAFIVGRRTLETPIGWVSDDSVQLIDVHGRTVTRWSIPNGVLDIAIDKNRAFVLDSRNLVRLDPDGAVAVIEPRQQRDSEVLVDDQGRRVICRKRDARESTQATDRSRLAACRSSVGWSFEGSWQSVEPVLCGRWLVEPIQPWGKSATNAVQVRSVNDGKVIARAELATQSLSCWGDEAVFDTTAQRRVQLPQLVASTPLKCGGGTATMVAAYKGVAACLDKRGRKARLETVDTTTSE
jgi:hypothetical protein